MCTINFSVTRSNGSDISSVQVRYRLEGAINWSNAFNTSVLNPTTPDIPIIGTYQLQVRIGDSGGVFSDWTDAPGTFQVSRNCSGSPIEGPIDGPIEGPVDTGGDPIIVAPDTGR